jgi:hypothetical protein
VPVSLATVISISSASSIFPSLASQNARVVSKLAYCNRLLVLGVGVWLFAVVSGLHWLLKYETTPGAAMAAADRWPAAILLPRDPIKPTLVMLVHPQCACSRASLCELDVLMSRCPNLANVYVVFERPAGLADDPSASDLWRSATAIRGVHAVEDRGVTMAKAFHARTSGEVFLYDASGLLRFTGGITESRGHAGDNEGRTAIEQLLQTGKTALKQTPAFGCALQ